MIPEYALIIILVALGLVILYLLAHQLLYGLLRKYAIKTKPNGPETPADLGLEYESLTLSSGESDLQAWWVKASSASHQHKAILIFHGNDETISEWIPAQQILSQHGFSSLVFDYRGFGTSTGKPTFKGFRQDAVSAWKCFQAKAGPTSDKYLLALSLGTGILLDAYPSLAADVRGVILIGTFLSFREIALSKKMLPPSLIGLLPDIYNNASHVKSVQVPLLMVHSECDELFSPSVARQVYAAANEPKSFVLVPGLKHNDMLEGKAAEYLAPVITFMQGA